VTRSKIDKQVCRENKRLVCRIVIYKVLSTLLLVQKVQNKFKISYYPLNRACLKILTTALKHFLKCIQEQNLKN
jgi:hypothetical protein